MKKSRALDSVQEVLCHAGIMMQIADINCRIVDLLGTTGWGGNGVGLGGTVADDCITACFMNCSLVALVGVVMGSATWMDGTSVMSACPLS